jgi:hypothetical protein
MTADTVSTEINQSEKETFGNFDLTRALEFLDLFPYFKWEIQFDAVQPSDALRINLQRAERQIVAGSNEWEQRLFIELLFLEATENHNVRMWQEKQIDAGKVPFRGKVDFAFTPYQVSFKTPFLLLAEAKKDDFEQGWGQCLIALRAAQMLNERIGYRFPMLGIVSSGRIWEFGKLTIENRFYRSEPYTIAQPELILGILHTLFLECERQL